MPGLVLVGNNREPQSRDFPQPARVRITRHPHMHVPGRHPKLVGRERPDESVRPAAEGCGERLPGVPAHATVRRDAANRRAAEGFSGGGPLSQALFEVLVDFVPALFPDRVVAVGLGAPLCHLFPQSSHPCREPFPLRNGLRRLGEQVQRVARLGQRVFQF